MMSSLNLFCAIHVTLLGLSSLVTVGFIITHILAFTGSPSEILLRPLSPLLPLLSVLPAKCDLIDTCSPQISIYKWPALWLIILVTCLSATPFPLPLWPLFLLPQLTLAFTESDCETVRALESEACHYTAWNPYMLCLSKLLHSISLSSGEFPLAGSILKISNTDFSSYLSRNSHVPHSWHTMFFFFQNPERK